MLSLPATRLGVFECLVPPSAAADHGIRLAQRRLVLSRVPFFDHTRLPSDGLMLVARVNVELVPSSALSSSHPKGSSNPVALQGTAAMKTGNITPIPFGNFFHPRTSRTVFKITVRYKNKFKKTSYRS